MGEARNKAGRSFVYTTESRPMACHYHYHPSQFFVPITITIAYDGGTRRDSEYHQDPTDPGIAQKV